MDDLIQRIEQADVWLSKVDENIWAVVAAHGDIGFVRKTYRMIERRIPGKQYVAWRRWAKTPSWKYWIGQEPGRYSLYADTRTRAIELLISDYNSLRARKESQG